MSEVARHCVRQLHITKLGGVTALGPWLLPNAELRVLKVWASDVTLEESSAWLAAARHLASLAIVAADVHYHDRYHARPVLGVLPPNLRSLALTGVRLHASLLPAAARQLETLHVFVPDAPAAAMAGATWERLHSLVLSGPGLAALVPAVAERMPALRELLVYAIDDKGIDMASVAAALERRAAPLPRLTLGSWRLAGIAAAPHGAALRAQEVIVVHDEPYNKGIIVDWRARAWLQCVASPQLRRVVFEGAVLLRCDNFGSAEGLPALVADGETSIPSSTVAWQRQAALARSFNLALLNIDSFVLL